MIYTLCVAALQSAVVVNKGYSDANSAVPHLKIANFQKDASKKNVANGSGNRSGLEKQFLSEPPFFASKTKNKNMTHGATSVKCSVQSMDEVHSRSSHDQSGQVLNKYTFSDFSELGKTLT